MATGDKPRSKERAVKKAREVAWKTLSNGKILVERCFSTGNYFAPWENLATSANLFDFLNQSEKCCRDAVSRGQQCSSTQYHAQHTPRDKEKPGLQRRRLVLRLRNATALTSSV